MATTLNTTVTELPESRVRVEAEVGTDELDRRVTQAARQLARQAQGGDYVVQDFAGEHDGVPYPCGEGRDQMNERGSGRFVPGFEAQLDGAVGGEDRTVKVTFPDDYPAAELAGQDAEFAVT